MSNVQGFARGDPYEPAIWLAMNQGCFLRRKAPARHLVSCQFSEIASLCDALRQQAVIGQERDQIAFGHGAVCGDVYEAVGPGRGG